MKSMRPQSLLLTLLFILSFPVSAASELKVLTSITPLQLIASEILAGATQPGVLLPPGASPHQYSLRPSDVRKVQQADLIFWVGPELERFLEKSLGQTHATVVTLMDEEEAHHEDATQSSSLPNSHHEDEGDEHDHGGADPHIWLDPLHALEIAEVIRDAAVKVAPAQKAQLDSNYAEFSAALLALDKQLMLELSPLATRGFVVFHDAYHGFVTHYNLLQLDAITVNPSRKAGAQHLAELREAVIQSKAVCIFSEPQFSAGVLQAVTSGSTIRTAQLDPLGQSITPGKGAYLAFLTDFAGVFKGCLKAD
jgi:zinc transport system substrate-binding protein